MLAKCKLVRIDSFSLGRLKLEFSSPHCFDVALQNLRQKIKQNLYCRKSMSDIYIPCFIMSLYDKDVPIANTCFSV